uniref:phosphatidate phosphatase n=1 Tax=Salarias fasciatus TaxID=181472 RepID=A0A672IUY2_SALFA
MNIVGQLAETVFVTVKELYRGLNPATLTGGIDVIVVRQPDGSFQCSPFHVRFGKLGVLRSKEKIVDIEINGESVDLHMKLGDNGEAFFVEENENQGVPAHLCTSPIQLELPEDIDDTTEGLGPTGNGARRKKRRRKRVRSDSHLREEASSSSDEREREKECEKEADLFQQESSSPEELTTSLQIRSVIKTFYFSLSEEPNEELGAVQPRDAHPHSDGEQSPSENRPCSPKSDSELVVKSQDSTGPQMQWNWGDFPMVRHSNTQLSFLFCFNTVDVELFNSGISPSDSSHFRTIERQECFDMGAEPFLTFGSAGRVTVVKPLPRTQSVDLGSVSVQNTPPLPKDKPPHVSHSTLTELFVSCDTSVNLDSTQPFESSPAQHGNTSKRNHHLGPTDIYLDDLTTLDPEVAALYFPKSEAEGAFQLEQGQGSGSHSPQSVGSGAMDSGTEYLSDSTSYNMEVSMSLCGQEGDTSQITKEKFMEHFVTYQDFANNPGIIEDPSLVICINSNYYNWAVAAPMVLSMTAFQKNLPKSTVERLVKDKMPKKSGRWWFSWRRRELDNSQRKRSIDACMCCSIRATLDDIDSDEAAGLGRKAVIPPSMSAETLSATQSISQVYRKSLRLTSKQIEHLKLREGANKVVFSVTTQYQGTCRCEAAIYLWNWNDRVIISDIDGTITKSDALGHILPQFGKDWTHKGIAKLYHKIHENGYKFLYCSARAIGMAAITKDYLHWVNDRGTVLPKGPVLLAPSSLFSALHREVIEKKPEVFKVACLSDIRDLFNPGRQPFYAAFGNRTNDAFAYTQVGVPEARIFTVNPKGELIQEKTKGNKSSYCHLGEAVDHFFPELTAEGSASSALHCPEFSSFSFWKEPLPELDLDALL